jgi:riboflavin synthase
MFTGLIEAVGRIVALSPDPQGFALRLDTDLAPDLVPGESLAVNGVCLTVVSTAGREVRMDVSPETARVTTIAGWTPGTSVNLERSLAAGARLGGHFVQGHVDAVGSIVSIEPQGDSWWLTIGYPEPLAAYIVKKGSIAVDGISLTVADVGDAHVAIQIVPFTWEHTNLRGASPGVPVNIETDILGKYVVRAVEASSRLART